MVYTKLMPGKATITVAVPSMIVYKRKERGINVYIASSEFAVKSCNSKLAIHCSWSYITLDLYAGIANDIST